MPYPTTQGYLDRKTCYSSCLTSTTICENSIFTATRSKEKNCHIKPSISISLHKYQMGLWLSLFTTKKNRAKYIVANANKIRLSLRIYILLIHIQTSTTICNMLCCMNHNFHTYLIKSLGKSRRNLHSISMQTSLSLLLSYWPPCSPRLIIIGWWSYNPRAYASVALCSVPKVMVTKLSYPLN